MPPTDQENQLQARWLLENGWLTKELLTQALGNLKSHQSLSEYLYKRGMLSKQQVQACLGAVHAMREEAEDEPTLVLRDEDPPPSSPPSAPPMSAPPAALLNSQRQLVSSQRQALTASSRKSPGSARSSVRRLPAELKAALPKAQYKILESAKFARYEFSGEFRVGGMGVVVRARDSKRETEVAIKLLHATKDPVRIKRFEREAQILQKLGHRHIVGILEHGTVDNWPYCIMNWIDGPNLEEYVKEHLRKQGALPDPEELREIFDKVGRALSYCHSMEVIHRDIKPENIVLERDGHEPVLVDFGLVKAEYKDLETTYNSLNSSLTKSGSMLGTPAFMSPEQLDPGQERGEVGKASDVWSFGATLYFALTGRRLYVTDSMALLCVKVLSPEPVPFSDLDTGIPPDLVGVCKGCLQKDASARLSMEKALAALNGDTVMHSETQITTAEARGQDPMLKWALLGIILVLSLSIVAILLLKKGKAEIEQIAELPAYTNKSILTVKGKLSHGGVTLQIGGQEVGVRSDGQFRANVRLKEGMNRLVVKVNNSDKNSRELEVFSDQKPPVVSFSNRRDEKQNIILKPGDVLTGVVEDDTKVTISCENLKLEVDRNRGSTLDGRFEFPMALKLGSQFKVFKAVDLAGNELTWTESVVVRKPSEVEAGDIQELTGEARAWAQSWSDNWPASFLTLLAEVENWRKASRKELLGLAKLLTERLGVDWQFVNLKKVECGDLAHWMLTYKHRILELECQLIPGGWYEMQWWSHPEMHYVIEYLEALCQFQSESLVYSVFVSPPYKGIRKAAAQALGMTITEYGEFDVVNSRTQALKVIEVFKADPDGPSKLKAVFEKHRSFYKKKYRAKTSRVYVKPFLLGRTETPQSVWQKFSKVPKFKISGVPIGPNFPVAMMSHDQVSLWLDKVNRRQLQPKVRMPTEIEWLYACAGGSKQRYFWGNDYESGKKYLWTADAKLYHNPKQVVPAWFEVTNHKSQTNAFGLSDMLGNVSEFCEPVWPLWKDQRPLLGAPPDQAIERLVKHGVPVMGGSVGWPRELVRRELYHYKGRAQLWGICGVRCAFSLP